MKTAYPIIIGGENFGCGSSREHAPVAMGAAGGQVVVAQSYARIFFRNCVATGELYPVEAADGTRLCDVLKTGDEVEVDMEADTLKVASTGKVFQLKPLGEVRSWNGMEWNGMEWNGMEWDGMGWNGMEWNGMEWNGMEWNGMEWNGGWGMDGGWALIFSSRVLTPPLSPILSLRPAPSSMRAASSSTPASRA
jgi:hypothetical protein